MLSAADKLEKVVNRGRFFHPGELQPHGSNEKLTCQDSQPKEKKAARR